MAKVSNSKKTAKKPAQPANGKSKKAANKKKTVELENENDIEDSEEEFVEDESAQTNTETKSTLLGECQKHFETTDLYKVLELEKSKATANDIKKAYYKLSLKYHPDKVTGDEAAKKESTIKFQVLGKIYSILGDDEKKKVYDESGVIDGEDDASLFSSNVQDWEKYWRSLFKKVSKEDIDAFFKSYKNSAEERADLLKFYEKHKGDMDLILEEVFSEDLAEDEERFRSIIEEAIESGEVKKYAKFTGESKKKAGKRKANYEKEAKEAEEARKELGIDESEDSLRKMILSRRQVQTESLIDQLTKKYGGENTKKAGGKAAKKGKKAVDESSNQENVSDEEIVVESKKKTSISTKQADSKAKKVKRL